MEMIGLMGADGCSKERECRVVLLDRGVVIVLLGSVAVSDKRNAAFFVQSKAGICGIFSIDCLG